MGRFRFQEQARSGRCWHHAPRAGFGGRFSGELGRELARFFGTSGEAEASAAILGPLPRSTASEPTNT